MLLHIVDDQLIKPSHGHMPSPAHRLPLLMAAAAAVVAVDLAAPARARARHARAARGANRQPGQECWPIDDSRRCYLRAVLGQPALDLIEQLQWQDGRNRNLHYRGRIMEGAGSPIPDAVSPSAGGVAGVLENAVERPYPEVGTKPGAIAVAVEPACGLLDAERPRRAISFGIEPVDEPDGRRTARAPRPPTC